MAGTDIWTVMASMRWSVEPTAADYSTAHCGDARLAVAVAPEKCLFPALFAGQYAIFRAWFQSASAECRPFDERGSMAAKKGTPPTKSEVLKQISNDTGLTRQQVDAVFDSMKGIMRKSLRSHGLFTLPGVAKMKVVKKPATKAREGTNPFTGEKMTFKAKPASKKVRVTPLKGLKDMVS